MIKQPITYTDYNGMERTEGFYFNLTEVELLDMNLEHVNLQDKMRALVDAKDMQAIMKLITKIIYRSYGIKSEDGKHFHKSDEISTAFMQSPAYTVLFMDMLNGKIDPVKFIKGIVPSDIAKKIPDNAEDIQAQLEAAN